MIEHLGEVPLSDVLPFLGGPPKEFRIGARAWRVRLSSTRYYVFNQSQVCAACGRWGNVLMLDVNPGDKSPHFNLYAREKDRLILMTRDHITPRSRGGSEGLHNQRTMCSPCNHFRANDESLTLEEIRDRKRTRPIVKAAAGSNGRRQMTMTTAAIGEKIKEVQDFHRGEAKHHNDLAAEIGAAWSTWDIDELLQLGAIDSRDAEFLRAEKEKQP